MDTPYKTEKPVKVIVTFQPKSTKKVLKISDFSFMQTQELLKDYKGSFSEEVVAERRIDL